MSQTVVITGLAQGMGLEVVRMLAKSGCKIAGFDVEEAGIASLGKELDALGAEHLLEVIDITDRPGILEFRDRVLEKFNHIDIVISNVGIGFFGPFEETDLEKALKPLKYLMECQKPSFLLPLDITMLKTTGAALMGQIYLKTGRPQEAVAILNQAELLLKKS